MRPWVLRALVMTLLYGVGQTAFVALSSRFVEQTLLWTILLLGLLLLVGLLWGGAEVITDRVPPEWTWLKASLVTGPAAGVVNWLLLMLLVDSVGVEDLGSALVGRAAFTVLLVLASVSLGSRFGWLSLRRSGDPRAESDPGADVDEPVGEDAVPTTRSGEAAEAPALPASTAERVAARRARRLEEREARESGRTSSSAPSSAPSPAPPSPSGGSGSRDDDPARVPFGGGPFGDPPSSPTPAPTGSGYASPVVAVLPPVTPLSAPDERATGPGGTDDSADDGEQHRGSRRRFGLRRPPAGTDDDGAPDSDR